MEYGDSIEITLNVDRSELLSQTYNSIIQFRNTQEQSIDISVKIDHYIENKILFGGYVIDAEYNRVINEVIVVSTNPNELKKINPVNKTVLSVQLVLPPYNVSVSPDGNYAAVGHNGNFSYVNLTTMETEKVYDVTADVYDIVLAPNNWVYVIPQNGQWERVRCINLSTGAESLSTGNLIRHRTKIKLHPSGNYIYGANTDLSPSNFEKYNITNGTAEYLYKSPYHGNYNFAGDIWIADDGNKLLAKSRNVFNSATIHSLDMTYNGQLEGSAFVITLDYHSIANKIYTIFTSNNSINSIPDKVIRKYSTNYLAFEGTIALPGFLVPDGKGGGVIYDSHGYFGFFNSSGTKFHVVVRAKEGSGIHNEWAIATIDVD